MSNQLPHLDHFYDGQVRRYITQIIRMMSGFAYKDNTGNLIVTPVSYGDFSRQVASIMRDNSENKMLSTPRMGVYVTDLQLDWERIRDPTHIDKINIRERKFDEEGNEYLDQEGKNYTVERLMPAPYRMTVNVDIWTSNLNQKLQLLEQILMLFNPTLELQSSDNYFDWTSLTVVDLENITWTSRTIPEGTDSQMDIATLQFGTPIWITTPAKVKRLGVVQNVISRIHDGVDEMIDDLTDIDHTIPEAVNNNETNIRINEDGELERKVTVRRQELPENVISILTTNFGDTDLLVMNDTIKLINDNAESGIKWTDFLKEFPNEFQPGLTQIKLKFNSWKYTIIGTFEINPADETEAIVHWDEDTIPTDTLLDSSIITRSNVDYIISPRKFNPKELDLSKNPRLLLLEAIGDTENEDGADAWKNNDGSDFVANKNSIVEWNGSSWEVVFDPISRKDERIFTTNLNTGVQYRFEDGEWLLSFEGVYPNGTFYIDF